MNLYTFDDLADIPIPPWVLPGWFREKSLTLISAPGGMGKSNFTQAMAISAAAGLPFLNDEKPSRPMRVVYFALDAPMWDYAHAARRIVAGLGVPASRIEPDDEEWTGGVYWRFDPLLISDGSFKEVMEETANPHGVLVDLVVVDCLRTIHDGNENDSEVMAPVMRYFRRWAEQHCAIMILHHSKKPGEFTGTGGDSARGSSAIHAAVDSHIVLREAKLKYPKSGRKVIIVEWAKGRGGDAFNDMRYEMVWNEERMRFGTVRRGRPNKPKRESNGFMLSPQKKRESPEYTVESDEDND